MPSSRRSSEENAIRCSMAWRGRSILAGVAVRPRRAGVGPVGAVEQPHQLGAPGAQEPGDADDLALEHVEVAGSSTPAAHAGGLEDRHRRAVDLAPRSRRWPRGRRAARPIILVTSSSWQVLDEVLAHELAVAQHRDAVGDLVDLLEEVAHEQDGDALARRSRITAKSCSTSSRSRLEVGSSRISTLASSTMARLIATSCWMAIEWLDSSDRVSIESPGSPGAGRPVDDAPSSRSARRGAARGRA